MMQTNHAAVKTLKKIIRPLRFGVGGRKINRSLAGNILLIIVLGLLGIFMALPLIYAVVNAFKPLEEFFMFPPRFIVMNPTIDNFLDLFEIAINQWVPFSRYVFNSAFISIFTTAAYVIISGMCAFVLAKHDFLGKKTLNQIIVVSLLFTSSVMAIPQYVIMSKLGMIDTLWVIAFPALGSTLGVFLLRQTMEGFPDSIIESAKIEGAGEMRICWKIVMPAIKPGWITVIIFTFQNVWNNSAANMIFTDSHKVLPGMLAQISTGGVARAGVGAAASLIIMLPPILVFVFSQSKIIETMANSGIKE